MQGLSARHGLPALAATTIATLGLTAAATASGATPASSGRTLMACLNQSTDSGNVFRSEPRTCAVHFANKPFDGNDIALLTAIRWSG
jgi:hypothetical protein